jgi:hypothetical protein
MKITMLGFALVMGVGASACSGTARGLEAYRADTQKLLDTRDAQLAGCYQTALQADPTLKGTVTVDFVVEKKSGVIGKIVVDPAQSNASKTLDDCVVNAVTGLMLAPADRHEGKATFVYDFNLTPAAMAPTPTT